MEVFKIVVLCIVWVVFLGGLLLWGALHLLGIWNTAQDIALSVVMCIVGGYLLFAVLYLSGILDLLLAYKSREDLAARKWNHLRHEKEWERQLFKGEITREKYVLMMGDAEIPVYLGKSDEESLEFEKRQREAMQ